MNFLNLIKESLSLDKRSLGLYRILLGFIVMVDVLYRLPDLRVFYTDEGIIPRSLFLSELSLPWSFSLHLANGSMAFMILCFFVHFLIGLGLSVGFQTRLMTFLAWLMTISVHNRNWLINNGGDDILRAILFISIFLPLGDFFSLDALTKKENRRETSYFSIWTLTFFFQVFSIYFMSYILKDHPIWREDYTALRYASALDIFATPLGIFLREFPSLQKILTVLTIFLEWLGPLLLVFSFLFLRKWWIARSLVLVSFWLLHLGIILCMFIGIFPYLALSIWVAFIPPRWWDLFLSSFLQSSFFIKIKSYFKKVSHFQLECWKPPSCYHRLYRPINFCFGVLILASLISWNLQTTKKFNIRDSFFHDVIRWTHIYQAWNMFAPHPKRDNIWLEIPAWLEDGEEIELITKSYDSYMIKNDKFYASIKNEHWRKFYLNLSENQNYLKYYASFLCREWNELGKGFVSGKKLKNMEIIVFSQDNLLDSSHGPVLKKFSWNHWCFEEDLKKNTTP